VAAVSGIKNPIKLARRVMEDGRHVMLAGDGALAFAREIGIPECASESLIVESARKRWKTKHGTVGCVAYDRAGRFTVATSTGGILDKLPGRVGDTPLIGCGTYADDYGAASCTGHGEAIIRLMLAKRAVGFLEEGSDAEAAAEIAVDYFKDERVPGTGGIILIDRWGNIGYARNTTHMPVCVITFPNKVNLDS